MNDQGITIKEIAQKLKISGTTVSRVLSGNARKYRISEKTETLVKETAARYDFKPNQIAQNLRLKRTNTIGLLIPDIANPFFANLARMSEQALRDEGKLILLCNTNDDTELEKETLALITGRQVDGMLVAPVGLYSSHFQKYSQTPMVFIDRYFKNLSIPYVSTDNAYGAYIATKHFLEMGHRNIACIQGLEDTISNQQRLIGIRKAMSEMQLDPNELHLLGNDFSIQNGYDSTKTLLQEKEQPTAIFTLSNQIAIGVMQAVNEHGLSIPEDISLISYDEQPYFRLTSPPVTTIAQPIEKIGVESVRLLMNLIQGQEAKSTLIEPTLIERASVRKIN